MEKIFYLIAIFMASLSAMDKPLENAAAAQSTSEKANLYLDELGIDLRKNVLPNYIAGVRSTVRDNHGDDVAEPLSSAKTYKQFLKEQYKVDISNRDAAFIDQMVVQFSAKPPSSKGVCLPNRVCLTAKFNPELLRHEFYNATTRAARIAEFRALPQAQKDESAVQVIRWCPSATVLSGLLEGGANQNACDKRSRYSLLRLAVKARISPARKERLIDLLAKRPTVDVDGADKYEITPLIAAAALQDAYAVRALLDANAAVNLTDRNHNSALCIAALTGNISIVKRLLSKYASIYMCNPYQFGNNVFAQAVQCSDAANAIPVLKELLAARNHLGDVNQIRILEHFIAIAVTKAVALGRADCVEFLMHMPGIQFDKLEQEERKRLSFNPDVPALPKGHSALTASLAHGHFEISISLLKNAPNKPFSSMSLSMHMREKALTEAVRLRSQLHTDAQKCAQLDTIIDLILQKESDLVADTICMPACYQAAVDNNHRLLIKLLTHGEKKDTELIEKVLLHAATSANAAAIGTLLEIVPDKESNPNVVDMNGVSLLHHLAIVADVKTLNSVAVLLAHEPNIFKNDKWGRTIFHKVPTNPDLKAQLILLETFAEQMCSSHLVNAVVNTHSQDTGDTPLHIACALPNRSKTVQKLIELGAKVKVANKQGNTPLHFACDRFETETVRVLLEAGADPNAKNHSGCGPLTKTAGAKMHKEEKLAAAETIRELLEAAGARLEEFVDGMARNAARHGNTPLLKKLLPKANVKNGSSSFGNTALHKAAQRGHDDTVALLLPYSDLYAQNEEGMTALELACAHDAPYNDSLLLYQKP